MNEWLEKCSFATLHELVNMLCDRSIDVRDGKTKEQCLSFLYEQHPGDLHAVMFDYVDAHFIVSEEYSENVPEELTFENGTFYYYCHWECTDGNGKTHRLVAKRSFPLNGESTKELLYSEQFPKEELPLVSWFVFDHTTSAMVDGLCVKENRESFYSFLQAYQLMEKPMFRYHTCEKQYDDIYSVEISVEGFNDLLIQIMYDVKQQEVMNVSFPTIDIWCTTELIETDRMQQFITEEAPCRMMFIME